MKRGRPCKVSVDEQTKILREFKKYFPSKFNIPSPSDPVFEEISGLLMFRMSPKALYLSIKRNYELIFDCFESDTNYADFQDGFDGEENFTKMPCKKFDFLIDLYQWDKLKPITQCYKRIKGTLSNYRNKTILPKHQWANMLREEIWKTEHGDCSWIFRNYTIKYENNVTCFGYCKECQAQIEVIIYWPTEKIVRCVCSVRNIKQNFKHHLPKYKIKLSPLERRELSEELKHDSAITVRNRLANTVMDSGDKEPSHLPTVGCLRQIKYESRKSSYYDSNPLIALWIMSKLPTYDKIIRFISLSPFCIYYWSLDQDKYFRDYKKSERTVLSIDATGSIFKPFGVNKDLTLTKPIFLYCCVMDSVCNERSVPIAQMISDNHNIDAIYNWLHAWNTSVNNEIPHEVVLDDSAALIGASVKAFTKCNSTKEYVQESYIKLETNQQTPNQCYIRIDTSHFIKILFNLSCFKHIDQRSKYFYIKCLLEVKRCDDYNEVKQILCDMITLCLNKYDGFDAQGNKTRCLQAKTRLKSLASFKSTNESEIELDNEPKMTKCSTRTSILTENISDKDFSNFNAKMPLWFYNAIETEKLIVTLSDDDNDSHDNLYYFPDFINTLSRLMGQLPLWSNIMRRTYASEKLTATSSNVESYFKNIKRHLCKINSKTDRYRIDEFIIIHLEYLSGELKSANSSFIPGIRKIKPEKRKFKKNIAKVKNTTAGKGNESIFADKPLLIENWKGLAKNSRSNRITNEHIIKKILLLRNGTVIRYAGKDIIISNTCAFDSVSQALAIGVVDDYKFSRTIRNSDNDEYFKFINMIADNNSMNIYTQRGEILKKYYDTNIDKDGKSYVNCECNVTYIFEKILIHKDIYSAEIHESCTNVDCRINNIKRKCAFIPLDFNKDTLLESAQSTLTEQNMGCRLLDCKGTKSIEFILNDLIAFEPNPEKKILLNDLPNKITLKETEYRILSVIEFVPPAYPFGIGHYKAHCRRGTKWQCYDDLATRITKSSQCLYAHCIMYAKKIDSTGI